VGFVWSVVREVWWAVPVLLALRFGPKLLKMIGWRSGFMRVVMAAGLAAGGVTWHVRPARALDSSAACVGELVNNPAGGGLEYRLSCVWTDSGAMVEPHHLQVLASPDGSSNELLPLSAYGGELYGCGPARRASAVFRDDATHLRLEGCRRWVDGGTAAVNHASGSMQWCGGSTACSYGVAGVWTGVSSLSAWPAYPDGAAQGATEAATVDRGDQLQAGMDESGWRLIGYTGKGIGVCVSLCLAGCGVGVLVKYLRRAVRAA
jgi:hypothetical protein